MYLETLDAAFAIDTGPRRAAAALLHGDQGVASGTILLIISATMVLGQHDQNGGSRPAEDQDPTQVAVYPLAAPCLLNPAGIIVLVTASAEASSLAVAAVVMGVLIVILAVNNVVFRWAVQVSNHLDASRMLVTEKVFGFLLAVQLVLNGTGSVAGSGAAARVDGWPRGDRTDAGRGMTGVGDWPGIY